MRVVPFHTTKTSAPNRPRIRKLANPPRKIPPVIASLATSSVDFLYFERSLFSLVNAFTVAIADKLCSTIILLEAEAS